MVLAPCEISSVKHGINNFAVLYIFQWQIGQNGGILKEINISNGVEVFWLAVQGRVVPIALFTFITLLAVAVVKTLIRVKGDDAMGNKANYFVNMVLDILYTMSANLAGGALLAKVLQTREKRSE